ncbi:MAG: Stp1/IreP family PP2C-type Ser/Thr phosphatase [Candidatus Obscuribacterales bacterium]
MNQIVWQVAAVTDPGLKRKENQDNFFVSEDNRVLVVADGMGGMRGGSRASKIAVEAVSQMWDSKKPHDSDHAKIQQWLFEAVSKANELVYNAAAADPAVKDMGTTIVAAIHSGDGSLQIAHVGDSRAYLVRDGKTIVLTQDHSVVMEMVLQGKMTEEQLRSSPFRHYLTRCVGHKNKVEIDKTPAEIKSGDWLILSSDGLSSVVHDEEIAEIVTTCDTPKEACDDLLNETLARGAPDNVTIVCVSYTQEPSDVIASKAVKTDNKSVKH